MTLKTLSLAKIDQNLRPSTKLTSKKVPKIGLFSDQLSKFHGYLPYFWTSKVKNFLKTGDIWWFRKWPIFRLKFLRCKIDEVSPFFARSKNPRKFMFYMNFWGFQFFAIFEIPKSDTPQPGCNMVNFDFYWSKFGTNFDHKLTKIVKIAIYLTFLVNFLSPSGKIDQNGQFDPKWDKLTAHSGQDAPRPVPIADPNKAERSEA